MNISEILQYKHTQIKPPKIEANEQEYVLN